MTKFLQVVSKNFIGLVFFLSRLKKLISSQIKTVKSINKYCNHITVYLNIFIKVLVSKNKISSLLTLLTNFGLIEPALPKNYTNEVSLWKSISRNPG